MIQISEAKLDKISAIIEEIVILDQAGNKITGLISD